MPTASPRSSTPNGRCCRSSRPTAASSASAHATWNGEEGYILRLYVHPDHRGAGHGRELLAATRTALADRGVDRVNAMVLAANDDGNEFYERFGFERADESETVIDGESYRENRYVLDV